MSAKKTDISQIRKYLNGELDARAMHQLERRAQDDPFLMDALEGYTRKKDLQANLNDLQNRLTHRVGHRNKKIVALWPLISIAATILVMLSVGAWWFIAYQPSANKMLPPVGDKTVVAMVPVSPQQPKPSAAIKAPVPQHHEVVKPAPVTSMADVASATAPVEDDTKAEIRIDEPVGRSDVKAVVEDSATKRAAMREVVVNGYTLQQKNNIAAVQPVDKQLQGRVAGVTITSPTLKQQMDSKLIMGLVAANDDKLPLPGVSVRLNGKNTLTQADAQGRYKIAVSKPDKLSLGDVGYEPQTVSAKGDSINVAMNPQHQALSEVVVGYGTQQKISEAHPVLGWDKFKSYMAVNSTSPDGKTGKVKVQFVVNVDNSLSGFKITKSLSAETDAKAISLIKGGPAWTHNINGQAETVEIEVFFNQ